MYVCILPNIIVSSKELKIALFDVETDQMV